MTTFPSKPFPLDSVVDALSGTSENYTGIDFPAKTTNPSSSPPVYTRWWRIMQRITELLELASQGRVWDVGGLNIGVNPVVFTLTGVVKTFAGLATKVLPDNATTFVWLDTTPAVATGAALPADATTYLPLAQVVTVSGDITSVTDLRSRIAFEVPQNLSASYATDALDNLGVVAINKSLGMDTDNVYDVASAAQALKSLFVRSSMVLTQLTFDYTVTWPDPAADVAIAFIDPGVASTEVILADGAQTLASKTLLLPIIGDHTNANHDHSSAPEGGVLTNTAFGTGKYFPVSPATHYESGTLAVAVLSAEYVAPFAFTLRTATGRVKTAPTGDTLIVDVRINGTSIFATQAEMIAIAAGTNQDTSATKDHAVAAGDIITYEVEQIGSTLAGADLTIVLNGLAGSTV